MKPEAINVAIAEACGWTYLQDREIGNIGWQGPDGVLSDDIPNYYGDLNAMHSAEKVLEQRYQVVEYGIEVVKVIERDEKFLVGGDVNWGKLLHATAAQRAEALLRTIGKWIDQPKDEDE